MRSGFIYFLECDGFIKIGWSRNPQSRLRLAKSMNRYEVRMLGFYKGTEKTEKALHAEFHADRVRNTEWFGETSRLYALIEERCNNPTDVFVRWVRDHCGSQVMIAKELGLTPGAINQWVRVPVHHLAKIERITGISRFDLRPDIFVVPEAA